MKISPPARRPSKNGADEVGSLSRWPRRTSLSLLVVHRGGPESWYEVTSRGRVWRFPGHWAMEDVMAVVYGEMPRASTPLRRRSST